MRYLVVSEDALVGRIRTSEHFPCIVNAPPDYPSDAIVAKVFEEFGSLFQPKHGKVYIVVPMDDARRVTFRKRQEYDVHVSRF